MDFISIHAPREGSDHVVAAAFLLPDKISIHAPREGSDDMLRMRILHFNNISIHAPREGRDPAAAGAKCRMLYFYPRSPRGERPLLR